MAVGERRASKEQLSVLDSITLRDVLEIAVGAAMLMAFMFTMGWFA